MRPTKVVFIGAGSASFGPGCLIDAIHCEGFAGSTMVLVDIDERALNLMHDFAQRINKVSGAGIKFEKTMDRREALPDAEFVINSIAVERNELWKLDWQIPKKYGIRQVLGENGGPGGLSHSLRNIPRIIDICRDMEELCPDAWFLNFSNPESRLCMAISQYTSIKSLGLCHGIFMGIDSIAEITGIDKDDIDARAAGLNHFTWMLSLHRKSTGEDIYPLLRRKERDLDPEFMPLTRDLFRSFGLFPNPSDDHIGEYLSYAWGKCDHNGYDFAAADAHRESLVKQLEAMAWGDQPVDEFIRYRSGEIVFDIISGMLKDTNEILPAVNIPNRGCITNLPVDAVVEVPAVVSAAGIHGLCVGDLPTGIAALCSQQVGVQKLVVEAAMTGCRETALQALLVDPVIDDIDNARKCLDELLAVHAPYLPQFK
jgi:alpha-galactosidase